MFLFNQEAVSMSGISLVSPANVSHFISDFFIRLQFSTKFDVLDFPSVTICNLNAVRISKVNESTSLYQLIDNVNQVYTQDIDYQAPTSSDYFYGGFFDFWSSSSGYYDYYGYLYDSADYADDGGVFQGSVDESVVIDNQYKKLIGEMPL